MPYDFSIAVPLMKTAGVSRETACHFSFASRSSKVVYCLISNDLNGFSDSLATATGARRMLNVFAFCGSAVRINDPFEYAQPTSSAIQRIEPIDCVTLLSRIMIL